MTPKHPAAPEGERECPTCGPTTIEPHPRRQGVSRCANCKEWLTTKCEGLAPFCCNNPDCPVHGERIDPAELDAARLVGDMAEAEVVALVARAESAEAALAAEKEAHAGLQAGVEALADEWERTHLTGFCSGGCDSLARGNKGRFVTDLRVLLAGGGA